jgi:uncharacterized glyoxalase superfamily protein PhnB
MDKLNLKAKEIMAFVPSGEDFPLALRFYQDLGFEVDWKSDDLAVLRKDACRFFLQKLENEEMRKNFMMNLDVEDLDAWWQRIQSINLKEKYPGARAKPPQDYPWGKREIHLIGPDGVLWHIAIRI